MPDVHGAMCCGQKRFMLLQRYHQLLFWFLAKYHLPRVSRQSCLLANANGSNEMKLRAGEYIFWHLSYGWGKSLKISISRQPDEGFVNSHRLKWGIVPPNDEYDPGRQVGRRKGGKGKNGDHLVGYFLYPVVIILMIMIITRDSVLICRYLQQLS